MWESPFYVEETVSDAVSNFVLQIVDVTGIWKHSGSVPLYSLYVSVKYLVDGVESSGGIFAQVVRKEGRY